jgi:uncharacterized repeat protein (TIGR03837 family)
MPASGIWDLFCRVIDNHGDLGVGWRLASQLATAGAQVRLWVDDARALQWMAPDGFAGVAVHAWPADDADIDAGDVVIELFGCDPPARLVERMATRAAPPVWINLEYLSAEAFVERSHGLPSPQRNGMTKWFYYPGLGPRSGGLLRGPLPTGAQAQDWWRGWLANQGVEERAGERLVTVFCYPGAPIDALIEALAGAPTLLALTPGPAQAAMAARGISPLPPSMRTIALPWFTQNDYDCLLHAADLNIVRGEDSFVRAIWAGRPFIWHIYAQDDGAHAPKLAAMAAALYGCGQIGSDIHACWRSFSGLGPAIAPKCPLPLPAASAWADACERARAGRLAIEALTPRLLRFVDAKR